jgi:hypothetical protein
MSRKALLASLLGMVALTLSSLPAAAAGGAPAAPAVPAPAAALSEPSAGCGADLALFDAAPAPVCAVPAEGAVVPDPAGSLAGRTCRCSCGTVPCKTSADCGGGICGAGITCC